LIESGLPRFLTANRAYVPPMSIRISMTTACQTGRWF
jgi:hypothetical protein